MCHLKKALFTFLVCVLSSGAILKSQQIATGDKPISRFVSETSPAVDIPIVNLELNPGKPVSGVESSPVVFQPIECSPTGDVLLQIPKPPDFKETRTVSLGEQGGRTFDLGSIPKLQDIKVRGFFSTDSHVIFLIHATTEPKESEYMMQTDKGASITGKAKLGEHTNFLVIFQYDGAYKSTVDLPAYIDYRKAAELSSGDFLLLGYNSTNRVAALQLFNSSGQLIRTLELPNEMINDERL